MCRSAGYRSPRTPKPNSAIFHPDYQRPGEAAPMVMAPELAPYKLLLDQILRRPESHIFSRPIDELWPREELVSPATVHAANVDWHPARWP